MLIGKNDEILNKASQLEHHFVTTCLINPIIMKSHISTSMSIVYRHYSHLFWKSKVCDKMYKQDYFAMKSSTVEFRKIEVLRNGDFISNYR